ncbi:MAG: GntG family PLP-dependent aldolase [Haliangium ochraceum]
MPTATAFIDLRSDTVTRPSAGMRAAIAAAEVGDDVLGDDPTVDGLQRRMAVLLGQEAALFVPSGSMANQIALLIHCRPGDEVIVSQGAHTAFHEAGAASAIAGVQLIAVGNDHGLFNGDDVAGAAKGDSRLAPPTRLVCVENTHNRGGGTVWPDADLDSVVRTARARGLSLHLDGARLMNAAVASRRAPADLAAPFDTVAFAFSKGLGAPVGSVIAGRWPDIERATQLRKMLGGGMRQAGLLAAAALWALDHNVDRIVEDHDNARLLAERLAVIPGVTLDLARVQTNIVMADLAPPLPPAAEIAAALHGHGVRVLPFGPRRLRFVTHLDVDRRACEEAAERIGDVLARLRA